MPANNAAPFRNCCRDFAGMARSYITPCPSYFCPLSIGERGYK
jgi:hypothetical protein